MYDESSISVIKTSNGIVKASNDKSTLSRVICIPPTTAYRFPKLHCMFKVVHEASRYIFYTTNADSKLQTDFADEYTPFYIAHSRLNDGVVYAFFLAVRTKAIYVE